MKVSVILPVYNAERYLDKCLHSLLQQTYKQIEIIIIDDSSVDNSYAMAQKYSSANIKVVKQLNSGAAIARNTGLSHASGELIQFMDVDDFLSPDKIEKQVIALQTEPDKVAVCNYISFSNDQELKNGLRFTEQPFIYSSENPAEFLVNLWGLKGRSDFIQTNSWLVPRHIIDATGSWRAYRCPDDDGEFFARVLLGSKGVIYVPGIYNYYRRENHKTKLSQNIDRKYLQNTLLSIDLKYEYLQPFLPSDIIDKTFAVQYLNFAVSCYPAQKVIARIAERRFKSCGYKVPLPILGGTAIEFIKKIFGWKLARLIKYVFKR